MKNLLNKTNGWKTYVGAAVIFIAGGLFATKVIDQHTFEAVIAVAAALTAFGLRRAIG